MTLQRRALLQSLTAAVFGSALGCSRDADRGSAQSVALWFSYGGKNREVLERMVHRYNQSQQGIRVLATFQGDYFEALAKLRTAIVARSAPVMSHVVGEVVPYLHEAGVLEPLDAYPDAQNLGLVPALAQVGTYTPTEPKPLVALPFNRSTPILYWNGAMLERARLSVPESWDELREAAKALTVRSNDRVSTWGLECPISWWFWVALMGQAGGEVMGADGYPLLGEEAGVEALQLWQRMVHEDKTMRPPPGRDYNVWQVTNQDFLAGRAAMIYTSTAFLRYLEEHATFPVRAAPLPGFRRRAVPTGGTFFVMMKSAPDHEKQAAWDFLRWMMQPEQTIEWATSTGYMPVASDAVARLEREGFYQKSPNDRVAMDQLKYAMPWPWAESLFRVQRECVDPRLEEAVLNRQDARSLLNEARKQALEDT
ncbi:MAG TPA: ABC transporter substrate-binding protein [Polyangiaceae bacterium]|nr:ABC transporter substrate-binding protein [Polyangiaceae bacterium]